MTSKNDTIPKDWKIVKLGDEKIAKLIMGQSPPSSSYNEEKEGLPFFQGNTEFGPIYQLKIEQYTNQPMKIAEEGDVLISVRAPVGDVNIANFKLCIGRGLAAIRPNKEKMSELYLFYQLKHNETRIKRMSGGSTFKAITKKDLENLSIPLPPLSEQRKIAEILSSVDSAIQQVDEAIAKAERLKKGLMQDLLTKGIGHTEFRETEIGRIPEEWEVVNLGNTEIAQLIMGQSPPSSSYNEEGEGLPFCQGNTEFGPIYPSQIRLFTNKAMKVAEAGDVLISVRAPVGDVNIANLRLCIGRGLAAIRPNKEKMSELYLFYQLKHHKAKLERMSGGSTFKAITKKDLENLKIPLPPLEEQKKIAEILSAVDEKIALEKERKAKLERVKKGLMNDLLTGKKRVKVDGEQEVKT